MISLLTDPIRYWWEYYRQRPFGRMVELFVARIFRGGGDSDTEGLDLGIGLLLSLLALPGGFVSVLLFEKYGTLLQWMRGVTDVDPFASALPDEYFFITLSMAVTAAAAVWRWDAIFPDRRDYMNLVPLPISVRSIFFANLVAVLFLAVLIAVDVNLASCVLFPLVVGATQNAFLFFIKFAAVHALGVVLASVFAFFAVFALLGCLMALLPPRLFRTLSVYARALVVVYLVTLLCTSFALPDFVRRMAGSARAWTLLLPSCWFLGFSQSLRGHADPALASPARFALPGLGTVIAVALLAYAFAYRRHFVRIPEIAESAPAGQSSEHSRLISLLDTVLLRTPFQQGCFRFVWTTMLRSEAHRLVLTGIAGLGLVLACQAAMKTFEGAISLRRALLTPDALSIPFTLAFLIVIGVRAVFEIPVELRSNWIFRLLLDAEKQECAPLARKLILILIVPWVAMAVFPIYASLEGFLVASLHTLLIVTWSVLLTNAALVRFRKLPFTCSLPVFQQHSIVTFLACLLTFFTFAVVTPQLEAWALIDPLHMVGFLPFAVVAWYVPRHIAQNAIDVETQLIFEEVPTRAVEVLQLGE